MSRKFRSKTQANPAKGGDKGNSGPAAPASIDAGAAVVPEIDYSPKSYTLRQQTAFGLKLVAIGGVLMLVFWVFELYGG